MSSNIAETVWVLPQGDAEYTAAGQNDIIDPLNNTLVDPSANQIVDTAIDQTLIASTVWESDDAS